MLARNTLLVFLFGVITLFYCTEAFNAKEVVELVTKNGAYYHANVTWTLRNFLHLPIWSIQSPYFPADNTNGLKWFLIAVTKSPRDGNGDVDLLVYPLGYQNHNISNLSVDFECAVIDASGRRRLKKSKPRYNIIDPGTTPFYFTPFLSRETLLKNQSQLLPNGHLTFECNLEGFVMRKPNNTTVSYLTTIEKTQPEVSSDCAKDIAESTMRKIKTGGYQLRSDITITASGKKFRGHKEILAPLLVKVASPNATNLEFGNNVDAAELKDLLSFMYRGKADNLHQSCGRLYAVAKKFGLLCLRKTCEDILIEQVQKSNAAKLLEFADVNEAVNLKQAVLRCIANGKC